MKGFAPCALLALAAAASAVPLVPTVASLPLPLTSHKRTVPITNDDGTANLDVLDKTLFLIRSKYQNTITAYLFNTGESLGVILPEEEMMAPNSTSSRWQGDDTSKTFSATSPHVRLGRRQTEPLDDLANDLMWAGTVSVGTPNQDFVVLFDTGSSDFFVPSIDCASSACSDTRYDSDASTTSRQQRGTFAITYGDGSSTSGPVVTDTLTIGAFSAPSQYFSPVTQLSDSFSSEPEDGIMGMAYPSISNIKVRHTIAASARVFGFHLAKTSTGSSELFLGGTNPLRYSGDIEWHPVQKQAYYNISMQPWIGNSFIFPGQAARNAIIDTGTTVIIAPPADAAAFWSRVPGSARLSGSSSSGYFTFPCSTPPAVSFSFGPGKAWRVSAADLNLGRVGTGSSQCVGAITGVDVGLGSSTWILGCSFLKNVYSVFDRTTDRVGFATPIARK